MIKETGCGVLIEPEPEEIADAIRDLMTDSATRSAMGTTARRVFLEKYTLSKAAEAYDAALTKMFNRSRSGRKPRRPWR
jgi:glycosyltransferase involved in cell wall biosynthesis